MQFGYLLSSRPSSALRQTWNVVNAEHVDTEISDSDLIVYSRRFQTFGLALKEAARGGSSPERSRIGGVAQELGEDYVPTRKNRERRTLIRHRASLMKMRVEVKNRIHMILDKYDLSYMYTYLFGKEGLEWLRSLNLPGIDRQILQSNLQILETLNAEIRNADTQIARDAVTRRSAGPKKNEHQNSITRKSFRVQVLWSRQAHCKRGVIDEKGSHFGELCRGIFPLLGRVRLCRSLSSCSMCPRHRLVVIPQAWPYSLETDLAGRRSVQARRDMTRH